MMTRRPGTHLPLVTALTAACLVVVLAATQHLMARNKQQQIVDSSTLVFLNATCTDPNGQLAVTIDVTPNGELIGGGQFVMVYDTNFLNFKDALPGDPFSSPVFEMHDANTGSLAYAVAIPQPNNGTDQPSTMATLLFAVKNANDCDVLENLVQFEFTGTNDSMLGHPDGTEVQSVVFNDLGAVKVDLAAPVVEPFTLTPKSDPDCEYTVNFVVDITENCGFSIPPKISVPNSGCADDCSTSFGCLPQKNNPASLTCTGQVVFENVTCPCEVDIAVQATDACGNMDSRTESITLEDVTPPVVDAQEDVTVNADPGSECTAMVELTATATDNCACTGCNECGGDIPAQDITFIIDENGDGCDGSDPTCAGSPCTYEFPQGTTRVCAEATDECDNTGSDEFYVTVEPFTELDLDLALDGAFTGTCTRCVHFELEECIESAGATPTFDADITFVDGAFSGKLLIPCGDYNCITAQDELHTLKRQLDLSVSNGQYVADFHGAGKDLIGGEVNALLISPQDDACINILDYLEVSEAFDATACYDSDGDNVPDGNTPCLDNDCTVDDDCPGDLTCDGSGVCRFEPIHADINCDGCVLGSFDFQFVQINFFKCSEECCDAGGQEAGGDTSPYIQMTVAEALDRGYSRAAEADVNKDGWIDILDVHLRVLREIYGGGWGGGDDPQGEESAPQRRRPGTRFIDRQAGRRGLRGG